MTLITAGWSIIPTPAIPRARSPPTQASGSLDVLSNAYRANPAPFREQRIGYLLQRGPECFDFEYYLAQNSDLRCRQGKRGWEGRG